MKTKLLSLLLMIAVCSTAFGQLRTGVHAGLGYSDVTSKTKHNGHLSYSAGVLGEYKLQNGVVFHGELNYVNKGATLKEPETHQWNGIINRYEFNLNYIELPLSVGYSFGFEKDMFLTPRIGIYGSYGIGGYGILASDNLKADAGTAEIRVNPFQVTQGKMPAQDAQYSFDAFQRPNAGLVLGVDFDLSNHLRLTLDAKMSLGYPLTSYTNAGTIHFRTVGLSIGYLF